MSARGLALAIVLRASAIGAQTPPPPAPTEAPPPVQVQALVEADYRYHASEPEGFAGFALRRARMGLRAQPVAWLELVFVGEYARAAAGILDAYAALRPSDAVEVNVGYLRAPTLPSGRDDRVFALPIPERSMTATALWPNRDLGVELRWTPRRVPIEAWARVGNGVSNPLGPEASSPTGYARVDVALGRASVRGARDAWWGLRVGVAGMLHDVPDRAGIAGTTPLGFAFHRPTPVIGLRAVGTAHARAWIGPVQLSVEGGVARESRAKDTDGNPATPRVPLDAITTWGVAVEAAWMLTGHRRVAGEWPSTAEGSRAPAALGALEVALRGERLALSGGAADVAAGGAWGGAAALRWWANRWTALSVAGYVEAYDRAPLEEPDTTLAWSLLLRGTVRAP